MYIYILPAIALLLIAFLAVIIARAITFVPKKNYESDGVAVEFDRESAIESLRAIVRCKTVSYYSRDLEDEAEFKKFTDMLPSLYPAVFRVCSYTEMEDRALLFKWEGKSHDAPAVMMSHYDVVPVKEDDWNKPPFEAILEDGVIWGRGTIDTKITLNAVLSAANNLIEKGFVPENDIYFAFSGCEEVNGGGAVRIVEYFVENNISPAVVLDEGGAVVEDVFPGVKKPCALIGIAEKGLLDLQYSVKSNGGHASAPLPHTPVGVLSKACCKVESHPFPLHITKPVSEMFDTVGRHSTFLYKIIFANLWCFKWVLDLICKKSGGEINGLMRTTVAFTQMTGSSTSNVIPPEAFMVSNMRLNPEDTVDSAIERIGKTIKDDSIKLTALRGTNPSAISETSCEGYEKIARAIASTWEGSIVSPYLMMQCSDSRHWSKISRKVYRFSAMDLTKEERGTVHGNNERIRVDCALRAVEFYIRLMKQC